MSFVQIIDFTTSRVDEIQLLQEKFRAERPDSAPGRVQVLADRDRPGHYMTVVEFESFEAAMKNNDDPATQEFAARMAELVDGPPTFINLDRIALEEF